MSGKGDKRRPGTGYADNYDAIFRKPDYQPEDEYAHDLFWHALNYRTAHPMDADRCWSELQDCVNRLIKRGGVWV